MSLTNNSASKRKRCENWGENEKITLFTLIEERVLTIECKKADSNTNKRKISAWREIEEKFNMMFTTNRTMSQLKEQWKRMKVAARKNISQYKKKQNATGGGTNNAEVSEMDWRIHSLLPHEFIKDVNMFDNDHENNDVDTQSQDPVVEEIEHQALVHHEENTEHTNDLICPIELEHGSYIEDHSYSIIADVNMTIEHDHNQNGSSHPDNNNISQAFLINTTSAQCGTDTSITPHGGNISQAAINTPVHTTQSLAQAHTERRGTNTVQTPHGGNISQAAINTPVHTTQSLAQAHTERRGTNTVQTPRRHDVNITQGSSRRSRTSIRSSRTRIMASESEYHQLLVERKSEEYDLKLKQMKEIHDLELKKRRIEVENLLLLKEKIKLEIEIITKEK